MQKLTDSSRQQTAEGIGYPTALSLQVPAPLTRRYSATAWEGVARMNVDLTGPHCHRRPHPHHSTRPQPCPRARPYTRWVADLLRTGAARSSDVRDRSSDRWDRASRARGIARGCCPGHGHVPRGVGGAWRCPAHRRRVPYPPQRPHRTGASQRACGVAGRFLLPSVRCSVLASLSGTGRSRSPGLRPAALSLAGVECRWLRQRLISPGSTTGSSRDGQAGHDSFTPGGVHVSSR
ncbi:hypothetical protein NG2371_03524 [Nocardia gamkensis]|nr:hypothetical protein [Nocardia gamkensis]